MSFDLSDIAPKEKLTTGKLRGKVIAVDLYRELYDILRGGENLHLGLLKRCVTLLNLKTKPAAVLDGKFPEVKRYPKLTSKLPSPRETTLITKPIVNDSKKILELLGIPTIQAPYSAEAQAAYLCEKGDAWAVTSQDFDPLLFASPRLIIGLSTAKVSGKTVQGAKLYQLKTLLKKLGIDQDQLIHLAMIIGTDYHPGLHGVSQRKALDAVKKYQGKEDFMFKRLHWNYAYPWREMSYFLKSVPVTNKYKLKAPKPKLDKLMDFLAECKVDKRKAENQLSKLS